MQIEWRDGFGTWTAIPEAVADGIEVTFADEGTVIGPSGHISAPDPDDVKAEWRDGFGDWVS